MSTNRLMTRRPVGIVWQTLLTEVFSTLARLERLSRCRNSMTRSYYHESLVNLVAEENIHPTLVDCHRLIWKEWTSGTLEQQHADLLYLCQPTSTRGRRLFMAIDPFLSAVSPTLADPLELVCFQSNF